MALMIACGSRTASEMKVVATTKEPRGSPLKRVEEQ
jgi:hypothetical protein